MNLWLITGIGIVVILSIELIIHKLKNQSFSDIIRDIDVYRTIQQIIIIFLSALVAIVITTRIDENKKREQYVALLENLFEAVWVEADIIKSAIDSDPNTGEYFNEMDDEMLIYILSGNDCTDFIDNVINNSESALMFAPDLYGYMLMNASYREYAWDEIYNRTYVSSFTGMPVALQEILNSDNQLKILIQCQIAYLKGEASSEELLDMYLDRPNLNIEE